LQGIGDIAINGLKNEGKIGSYCILGNYNYYLLGIQKNREVYKFRYKLGCSRYLLHLLLHPNLQISKILK